MVTEQPAATVAEVRAVWLAVANRAPGQAERFEGMLESVRAEERERIARNMDAEQRRARAAHQSAPTDHFAHDYCRWVGHAEAFGTAARVVREGA